MCPNQAQLAFNGNGRKNSDWFNSCSTKNTPMNNEGTKYNIFAPCNLLFTQIIHYLTSKKAGGHTLNALALDMDFRPCTIITLVIYIGANMLPHYIPPLQQLTCTYSMCEINVFPL